jgi:hypothetical protein
VDDLVEMVARKADQQLVMEMLGQKTNKLDTEICLHAIDILH